MIEEFGILVSLPALLALGVIFALGLTLCSLEAVNNKRKTANNPGDKTSFLALGLLLLVLGLSAAGFLGSLIPGAYKNYDQAISNRFASEQVAEQVVQSIKNEFRVVALKKGADAQERACRQFGQYLDTKELLVYDPSIDKDLLYKGDIYISNDNISVELGKVSGKAKLSVSDFGLDAVERVLPPCKNPQSS